MSEWEAYWSLIKHQFIPESKPWVFLKCLPARYQEHFRSCIIKKNWGFDEIVKFLDDQSKVLVPNWRLHEEWKCCVPKGQGYVEYMHWWLEFERLGVALGNLREEDWCQQFDVALGHRRFFTEHLRKLLEAEYAAKKGTWRVAQRF